MDFVRDFRIALSDLRLDPLFAEWGGLLVVSALLGRGIFTTIGFGRPIFGHLYVMFVAPSGFGKSTTMSMVEAVLSDHIGSLKSSKPIFLGPRHTTLARFMHTLGQAFGGRSSEHEDKEVGDELFDKQSVLWLVDEIGVLFGERADTNTLQTLANLWDMHERYDHQTVRGFEQKRELGITDHYMVAAFGAQPGWLQQAIPPIQFTLGMPARTHFVFAQQRMPTQLEQHGTDFRIALRQRMAPFIERLAMATRGQRWFSDAAFSLLQKWVSGRSELGGVMAGYSERRPEHLAKLAMLYSCARRPQEMTIELRDLETAIETLEATEKAANSLTDIVGANPWRYQLEDLVTWTRERGTWISETEIRDRALVFFRLRDVDTAIEQLVQARRFLIKDTRRAKPYREFKAA